MIRWLRGVGALVVAPIVMLRMFFRVRQQARVLSRPIWLVVALVVPVIPGHQAEAAWCAGTIEGTFAASGTYDPYDALDNVNNFRLTVKNLSNLTCKYGVVFRSNYAVMLSSVLPYTASADGVPSLVVPTNTLLGSVPFVRTPPVAPNSGTTEITYRITIPRGKSATCSPCTNTIYVELYAIDTTDKLVSPTLMTKAKALDISYTVNPTMSVNISGDAASTSTNMELGTLSSGLQGRVRIEARSYADYKFVVTSENHGVLGLTPAVPGQTWSVPYTATLSGAALNLSGATTSLRQPATIPGSDASHELVVTVGETAGKRAGRYEDTITIDIQLSP